MKMVCITINATHFSTLVVFPRCASHFILLPSQAQWVLCRLLVPRRLIGCALGLVAHSLCGIAHTRRHAADCIAYTLAHTGDSVAQRVCNTADCTADRLPNAAEDA